MDTRLILAFALAVCATSAARADEVEVLFGGAGGSAWDTARDPDRLRQEFAVSEVNTTTNPPALEWRFVPRSVSFNDLFLHRPVARDFASIRVRVRNEGAALALAAKAREASGAEWTTPRIPLAASNEWQWVEFPRADWRVAGWSRDADGRMDFPLEYFTLIALDVKTNVDYRLRVSRVDVVRPDPPVMTLETFQFPARLLAGQTARFTLAFSLDRGGLNDDAQLVFRQGREGVLRLPLALPTPPAQLTARQRVLLRDVEICVPLYTAGGKLTVELEIGGAKLAAGTIVLPVTIQPRQPGRTVAQVKSHRGTPTLFINGQPHNGMAWATYSPTPEIFRDFSQAGVTLFTFSGTPTEAGYGLSQTVWVAPDQFDYSQFDQRARMLLSVNPEAWFFPRLYLHAPPWWSEAHPDDVVLADPGEGPPRPFVHSGGKPAPSWASEAWRRDTVAALRRFIAHVEASPYADRVVGYHLASGTTEEWMMWGGNEDEWVDYSPANARRFRQWLRDKYRTVARLRRAWHDEQVSFATASIPTKAERQRTTLGSLRDPDREEAVIDFYLYNSDLVADTINYFAAAVKAATHRDKIVGAFYGYLLQLCGEQRQQNAGHLALGRVLASRDVDFLSSPTSYAFRQLGGAGTAHFMSPFDSVKLHGKLWFNENDVRTSLSGGPVGQFGRPANVDGDLLQQDKELALVLVEGAAQWWFDVGGNKYDQPRLMGRIGELVKNATQSLALDRAPVDEIALVVDERSLTRLRVGDPLGNWLLLGQLPALQRLGAPVGHYLASDLPRLQARHRMFLFPTSFAPTAAERRAVDALKRDGHVLVFLGMPGLYRDGRIDESAMSDFTGLNLRLSRDAGALRITLRDGLALIAGMAGTSYGVDQQTLPVGYADDPEATVLGRLPDGRAGLVLKQHRDWTAIYSAAPLLPASLLRRFAELGGIHFYTPPGDVVWATHDLLAVSVDRPGPRTLTLPRPATVSDLYQGTHLGDNLRSFPADFDERATRVFVLKGAKKETSAGPLRRVRD